MAGEKGDKPGKKAVATVVAVPIKPSSTSSSIKLSSSMPLKKTVKEFLFGIIVSSIFTFFILGLPLPDLGDLVERSLSIFKGSFHKPAVFVSRNPSIPTFIPKDQIEEECFADAQEMLATVDDGRFSFARLLALRIQQQRPACEKTLAKLYTNHADVFLSQKPDIQWLMRIATSEKKEDNHPRVEAPRDEEDCWTGTDFSDGMDIDDASTIVLDHWDRCCSQLATEKTTEKNAAEDDDKMCYQTSKYTLKRKRMCCNLSQGSLAYLRLPALLELSLRIRLKPTNPPGVEPYDIVLEQDGFLRRYDTAGVLWPTGYLLTLCMSDPIKCGIPELFDAVDAAPSTLVAVEIGAGTGAPSIAFSRNIQALEDARGNKSNSPRIVVTDRAPESLGLILSNARASGAAVEVTRTSDHTNVSKLEFFKRKNIKTDGVNGFAVVLGSSLEALFDFMTNDPRHKLWSTLDHLVDPDNPHALAILAHVKGAVIPPKSNGKFELAKTIPGNDFGMLTRSGDESDFEISVYKRTVPQMLN